MYQAEREALAQCEQKCKSSTCRVMDVNGTSAFIKQRGSSSSSSTTSSSGLVWCATTAYVDYVTKTVCDRRAGKVFADKSLAEAEHQRLKRLSGSSSTASNVETLQIWGGTYTGEVVNGHPHGQGTWTSPRSGRYVGAFKDGNFHGRGSWTHPDGDKYVGAFKDDKRHGNGTYTFIDGSKYVGEYKDNKAHGQGTYTFANGNKYVGEWKYDRQWEGIYYLASGEMVGTYSNGEWCKGCTPTARQ